MDELFGADIWQFWAPNQTWIIVTTNGAINGKGACIMGRGIAEQAARRFPSLPYELGCRIHMTGNRVYLWPQYGIITLPVKDIPYRPAYLPRIVHSIKQMLQELGADPRPVYGVRFGCGNGGLNWEDVKPQILPLLDNRFTIVDGGEGSRQVERFRSRTDPQGTLFPVLDPEKAGRIIIAGSRFINRSRWLTIPRLQWMVGDSGFQIRELVSGMDGYAGSPDMMGVAWANSRGLPIKPFPADWKDLSHPDRILKRRKSTGEEYDAKAGPRRNEEMGLYAGGLIAIWDGVSDGTRNMLQIARRHRLPIYLYLLRAGAPQPRVYREVA